MKLRHFPADHQADIAELVIGPVTRAGPLVLLGPRLSSNGLGADAIVAGYRRSEVGCGERGKRRRDARPLRIAVNVREQRLDAGDQRLAVE